MRATKAPEMEWEGTAAIEAPRAPESLKEAGLNLSFVCDIILRTLYTRGALVGLDLSRFLCLPFKAIEESLDFLKNEKCVEVAGGDLIGKVSYKFNLTDMGRRRAQEAMTLCAYVGPAPVPLDDYIEQCYRQAVTGISCAPDALRAALSHLVVKEELFNAIGPAIVSGRSVFIYGPPGNGKTSVANAIGDFMTSAGGEVYVPHAFLAENSIVTVFDQSVHRLADETGSNRVEDNEATIRRLLNTDSVDPRWVRIRRPVVITGGELHLGMLDLRHNAESNFYQAPLHIKANGGVFLIDDFGRQLVSPKELLNRWILPLESRHDYLTTAAGKKFEVPFEQLIIFSTNLDPRDLVDDAFLRRIRHKVEVNAPTRDVYEKIFNTNAKRLGMSPCPEAIEFLFERYYSRSRSPRASDCRDLLEIVQSICRFRRQHVHLNKDLITEAAATFICEF